MRRYGFEPRNRFRSSIHWYYALFVYTCTCTIIIVRVQGVILDVLAFGMVEGLVSGPNPSHQNQGMGGCQRRLFSCL